MADYEDNKQKSSFTLFNNETGKSYELPIIKGTDGPDVLDIRKLYQETGLFTYDPGFTSTASCDSEITFIDGNKGILRHRGYDIHESYKVWERMKVAFKGKEPPEWMSTHPSNDRRIESLNKWIPEIIIEYPPIKKIS